MTSKLRTLLTAAAIFLSVFGATAQGFYLKLNSGYNLPFAGNSQIANYKSYFDGNTSSITYKMKNVSYGSGINIDLGAGYMFNKNMGIEILGSYLLGNESIFRRDVQYTDSYGEAIIGFDEDITKINMFRLVPSFVASSNYDKHNIYGRLGLAIGVVNKIIIDNKSSNLALNRANIEGSVERYGGLAIGFASAIGISTKLTDKISIFGEMSLFSMSYSPTKGVMKTYKENGQDMIDQRPTFFKEEIFKDEVNFGSNIDISKPREIQTISYPMSSVGLNFGIKINL